MISQSFGAKNLEKLKKAVHTAALSSAFTSILLAVSGVLISPLMLRMIRVPENVFDLADSYLRIYYSGFDFCRCVEAWY